MAERIDIKEIVDQDMWTVVYDNAEGYQDKFYNIVRKEVEKSNFPNIEVKLEEFVSGGIFFDKETTRMIKIKPQKSQFKKLEIFFRAQIFGNTVVFTKMECLQKGLFDALKSGGELLASIRQSCANWAQYEEYIGLRTLGDIIFDASMKQLDPTYNERRMLRQK